MAKRKRNSLIEQYLVAHEMSVAELARRTRPKLSWRAVYRAARGQARVSVEMAAALHHATGGELDATALLGLAPMRKAS